MAALKAQGFFYRGLDLEVRKSKDVKMGESGRCGNCMVCREKVNMACTALPKNHTIIIPPYSIYVITPCRGYRSSLGF